MTSEDPVDSPSPEVTVSNETLFFERSLDLLAVADLDGYFRRVSAAFTQTLGYPEAELLATPFLEFVHPDDRPATLAEIEKVRAGTPSLYFENRYRTKDGAYRWLSWTASPPGEQRVSYCVARDITQQKQAETTLRKKLDTALRESEARNQLAMEVARMFTFEWEPGTDKVKRSPHCGCILGLTEADIEQDTGANYLQRVHPEDRDRFLAELQALTPDNSTYHTTYRVIRPDRQIVALEESGRALFDTQGQLIQVIGMTADVTKRQRLEAELQESRAILQRQLAEIESIYQSAPVGLNVLDTDLRFVRINQRLAEINGFSVEEHIGKTVRELLPGLADTAERLLRPILETGEPLLNIEIRGETPAQPGVRRVWLESFLPLKDGGEGQNQRVIGINTVCEEITERIQVEEALRQSEARFRMMADNAPVMVWVTDASGYCTYLSQSWYEFTGQTEAIGLGFGWLDAVHPEDYAAAREAFIHANRQQESFRLEYRLRQHDGEYRWAIDAANPWFDQEGNYQGYIGSVIDITDRKQAEAQREQILQREQAARESAERANRMKDEFLAVLSHELRTPLNPILGWAKLLQSPQISSAKLQQGLSTIERNAKQQVQLIEDLLNTSRIIRGQLSLSLAAVNLAEPIAAALETIRLAAEAKNIRLGVQLDPSVGQVKGDSGRLQQVIWSILSNAVKFTPIGGQITVQLTQVGEQAQLQVRDTGKGIQPEFLPHVFELFRQQDSSTTRTFGGLGLGLAIARQVVEAHGGTITAASHGDGQGATFTVQLPLMPAPGSEVTDPPDPVPSFANLRVLAVDDEIDSLDLIAVVLEQEGAQVRTVSSATEALPLLTESQFDLLISDIGMPEVDGYTFIRQVRALPAPANRNIPAIALTAYASETDRQQVLAAGFQAYLTKPIDPQHLLDTIAFTITSNDLSSP